MVILQESEISVLDEAMPKKSLTYLATLESVKAINRGKKVEKINRLKTCAICTRFYSALQVLQQHYYLVVNWYQYWYWYRYCCAVVPRNDSKTRCKTNTRYLYFIFHIPDIPVDCMYMSTGI